MLVAIATFRLSVVVLFGGHEGMSSRLVTNDFTSSDIPFPSLPIMIRPVEPSGCV